MLEVDVGSPNPEKLKTNNITGTNNIRVMTPGQGPHTSNVHAKDSCLTITLVVCD